MDIYYKVVGEGYPIVCLHGNGEDHHIFDELVDCLKDRYQLILIDSRYHGKSIKEGLLTYDQMKQDVLEVVSHLNLSEYDIIGFSDGAIIALMLGMDDMRLKHIVSIGANTSPQMIKPLYRYTFYMQYIGLRLIGLYHPKARALARLYKLMCCEPHILNSDLNKISVPTLILAGEMDMIKESDTFNIAKEIPYSVVRIIKGGNHFLLRDSFKSTFKEICLFLDVCHKDGC